MSEPERQPSFTVGSYGGVYHVTLEPLPWWHWRSLWARLRRAIRRGR